MPKNGRAQIRRSAGLTQMRLARLAEISQSRISCWENGDTELAAEDVTKIAKAIRKHLDRAAQFNTVSDLVRALAAANPQSVGLESRSGHRG
jgi:transcriptional regulator with XRE-family HTH domain